MLFKKGLEKKEIGAVFTSVNAIPIITVPTVSENT